MLAAASLMSLEFWPFGMHQIGTEPKNQLLFGENTFREGTAVAGDTSEVAEWRPIKEIASGFEHTGTTRWSVNAIWT